MAKNQPIGDKDAVKKLQLALLDGIQLETHLFAAGSVLSRPDYEDVVVERSIANSCGYPLCNNPLPSERPRKGRYRISLKEHKVYDLHETYMYCSSTCVVNSRAFAGSLLAERCLDLSWAKVDGVLRLFGDDGVSGDMGFEDWVGKKNGDSGIVSKLKIKENVESRVGEVAWDDWIGPSDAIEGYVLKTGSSFASSRSSNPKEGSKFSQNMKKDNSWMNEMDFTSVIITEDEYSISKGPCLKEDSTSNSERSKGKVKDGNKSEASSSTAQSSPGRKLRKSKQSRKTVTTATEELNVVEVTSSVCQKDLDVKHTQMIEESVAINETESGVDVLKSSLKSSASKKQTCSVTWADEKVDSAEGLKLSKFSEVEDREEVLEDPSRIDIRGDDNMLRLASAEACAAALSLASEAIASGESDTSDAVSEAGIIILPPCDYMEGQYVEEDMPKEDEENASIKWPTKPGSLKSEFFDPEDSWYDAPPEEFSLNLSPFAQMWMALFAWLTSSSLAFIYGRDDSSHEDYLSVNGREYPRKITLIGGRSSEIKQTLASCLARSFPGMFSDLRLPVPTAALERGMGRLLETMTFVDALPSLRVKQWQVITLLFVDALSVSRIPALTSHLTSRRMLRQKVLDSAQIGVEEYEVMKDLIIPLGRASEFSAQSGG